MKPSVRNFLDGLVTGLGRGAIPTATAILGMLSVSEGINGNGDASAVYLGGLCVLIILSVLKGV